MERMYEIGTKVIINPIYKLHDCINGVEMFSYMLDYRIHTVSDICIRANGTYIDFKLDNGFWYPDICLLPCPLFKVGQKVQINPDLPEPRTEAAYNTHFGVDTGMYHNKGEIAVITSVLEDKYNPNKPFEDGCLYRLDIDLGHYSWSSPMFNLKIYDNENQLQREESVNRGRSNREGSVVCGRRFEASVAVGYLSHKACVGFKEY